MRALIVFGVVVTAGVWVGAQVPSKAPEGTGLIVGRVIDGSNGLPVTRVAVTLGGPAAPREGAVVLVDSQGRFLFRNLSPGTFTLTAQKSGWISGAHGRMRPGGQSQPLPLRDGERIVDATLRIWRDGSITGTVLDDAGEPVAGAFVHGLRLIPAAGGQLMVGSASGRTDDRGMYRLSGLSPGRYIIAIGSRYTTFPMAYLEEDNAVRAAGGARGQGPSGIAIGTFPAAPSTRIGNLLMAPSGAMPAPTPIGEERLRVFPITFHPAASSPDQAIQVRLEAGEQKQGVDFTLALVPIVKVSGLVTGPSGPVANAQVRVSIASDLPFQSPLLIQPATTVTDATGAFTLLGVTAGRYSIEATSSINGVAWSASQPLSASDRDISNVALVFRPSARVRGRVVLEGSSPPPPPRTVLVGLDSVDGAGLRQAAPTSPDGSFDLSGARPGRYFLRLDLPAVAGAASQLGPWVLESAVLNGRDVSDEAIELASGEAIDVVVTLTDRPSALRGTVRNARGQADSSASVLVFPVDQKLWTGFGRSPRRLRTARPLPDGSFSVPALPAGDYLVAAVPDAEIVEWPMKTFLSTVATVARRVSIPNGGNAAVDVVTRSIR